MSEIIEAVPELVSMDLCLKFVDEVQANELLYIPVTQSINEYLEDGSAVVTSAVVEGVYTQRYRAILDQIGIIYKPTGTVLEDILEMAPIDGWHVNLRGTLTTVQVEALTPFIVVPQSPVRVWA